MRSSQRAFSIVCAIIAFSCLLNSSNAFSFRSDARSSERPWTSRFFLQPLFYFQSPVSLFVPSATISLTDDNSTFFVARPAAFGPTLPARGLSGELWIGSRFLDELSETRRLDVGFEGELGCGDVRNWPNRESNFDTQLLPATQQKHSSEKSPLPGLDNPDLAGKETANSFETHDENSGQGFSQVDGVKHKASFTHEARGSTSQGIQDKSSSLSSRSSVSRQTDQIFGKVVLLSRGGCGFSEKVKWAQKRGAVAVIIGDNRSGPLVRMYARGDTSNITIPSIFTSYTSAEILSSLIPEEPDITFLTRKFSQRHSNTDSEPKTTAHELHNPDTDTNRRKIDTLKDDGKDGALDENEKPEIDFDSPPLSLKEALPRSELLASGNSRLEVMSKVSRGHQLKGLGDEETSTQSNLRELEEHLGLWVTLTPTDMNSSPFFHTLFVLVVSPLLTLIIVYSMLLLRSRIRRRRWRAPKSVVERLPVRTYHTFSSSNSTVLGTNAQDPSTSRTPLLAGPRVGVTKIQARSCNRYGAQTPRPVSASKDTHDDLSDSEKSDSEVSESANSCKLRQRECVVCLEEYVNGVSRVMRLPCGHEFHVECITPWLTTRRRTCPICKGDVVRSMRRRAAAEAATASDSSRSYRASCDAADDEEYEALEFRGESNSAAATPATPSNLRTNGENMSSRLTSSSRPVESSSQWIWQRFNRGLDLIWRNSWEGRNNNNQQRYSRQSQPRQ